MQFPLSGIVAIESPLHRFDAPSLFHLFIEAAARASVLSAGFDVSTDGSY